MRGFSFDNRVVNGIATAGGAKTAWFKDSEGNTLAISQRVPV